VWDYANPLLLLHRELHLKRRIGPSRIRPLGHPARARGAIDLALDVSRRRRLPVI